MRTNNNFIFLIYYINFTLKTKILNRFWKAVVCCVAIIEMFIELENIHFFTISIVSLIMFGCGTGGMSEVYLVW